MDSKVLITGSDGYMGSNLANHFCNLGIDFVGIDKEDKIKKNYTFYNFDLQDSHQLSKLFQKFKPTTIIHLGTFSALDYNNNLVECFNKDFQSMINLLEHCDINTKFIYASSSYVYSGLDEKKLVNEDTILNPVHNFGLSKVFFEQLLLRQHRNSVVLRFSSAFGHGNAKHPNLVNNLVLESRNSNEINIWGNGKRKLQTVHLSDCINSIVHAINLIPGVYNIGSDDYFEIKDIVEVISNFKKVKVNYLKEKKEGETLPYMDNSKIKNNNKNYFKDSKKAIEEMIKYEQL